MNVKSILISIMFMSILASCGIIPCNSHEAVSSRPSSAYVPVVRSSGQLATDSAITAKVKSAFIKEKLFGSDVAAMSIRVETINGVVYLSGTADSREQVRNAIRIAKSIKGVRHVDASRVIIVKN